MSLESVRATGGRPKPQNISTGDGYRRCQLAIGAVAGFHWNFYANTAEMTPPLTRKRPRTESITVSTAIRIQLRGMYNRIISW